MMKKLYKALTSQTAIVGILVLVQLAILVVGILKLSDYFVYLYTSFQLLSLGVVVRVVSKKTNPTYKLAWVIPILLFPIFGGLFYLFVTCQRSARLFSRRLRTLNDELSPYFTQNQECIDALSKENPYPKNFAHYMKTCGGWPVYQNTTARYLPEGELMVAAMLEELKKARHYIFLEFFIIDNGEVWDSMLEIMAQKAQEGVDVRVMYDGMGSLLLLPRSYPQKLKKMGIKAKIFNPFRPFLSVVQNNRDHRKILVIDGKVAFTGGINLADEYVNKKVLHGYWKDTGVIMRGDAVYSFTLMFLQMWHINNEKPEDYDKYRPQRNADAPFESDGFVLPYGDSPMDFETVGKGVYLDIINKAKSYVHITTPYLVLDNELVTALTSAAKSGVDIKIITPNVPDRWYMYIVAWSFYGELIAAGVKIYEFLPGFIHGKTFVSDDETAVVGSINLDYRSLYLHFECACWFYKNKVVGEVEKDFAKTLAKCTAITLEDCQMIPWYRKLVGSFLRIFSPLM